tara:strand:+ start:571 stop:1704 length:1134 start_codon:yes stop_codon:yes gene_type:complete
MNIATQLKEKFVEEEINTTSDSFGGKKIPGKAPVFNFKKIIDWFEIKLDEELEDFQELKIHLNTILDKTDDKTKSWILKSTIRFSLLIELTNLKITSTKIKTRWHPCKIIKTRENSFQNYEGDFKPGHDPRSNKYEDCLKIFENLIKKIAESDEHLCIYKSMANGRHNSVAYEGLIKYSSYEKEIIHDVNNIELCNIKDISWLLKVRPLMTEALKEVAPDLIKKINTKTFKTDRSQTGEDQTNRAKRWECLGTDMQKASIEQCWSVERTLYEQLLNFKNFPRVHEIEKSLKEINIYPFTSTTKCPITLEEFDFDKIKNTGSHGKSSFQVGHMNPLKNRGLHQGDNISWISDDGNRIQGSLSLEETKKMLLKIMDNMR